MKKSIAIFATDIHISEKSIEVCNSIFNQLIDLSVENNSCPIILGGDIFTSRKGQSIEVMKVFKQFVTKCIENGVIIYAISGNHDKTDYFSFDSFLDFFDSDIELIRMEDTWDINDNIAFHFKPYFDESIYLERSFPFIKSNKKNYLFTHIAINGVKNNDGSEVTNCIPVSAFKNFDKVFCGHYHNHQEFDNIIYTGSAYQANFGEDERKGCYVFYSDGSYEFQQLNFPKYKTYKQHVGASQEEFTKLVSDIEKEKGDDHIRVKLVSDGLIDHSSKKAILQEIGIKVDVDKQDVIIDPSEAVSVYQPITDDELKKDFDLWSDEKKPSNLELGKKTLFE